MEKVLKVEEATVEAEAAEAAVEEAQEAQDSNENYMTQHAQNVASKRKYRLSQRKEDLSIAETASRTTGPHELNRVLKNILT